MAERYYYAHGGAPHGPYSALQMREFADGGHIVPTDPVWKEGTTQQIPASRVKNLYSPPASPALPALIPSTPELSAAPAILAAAPELAPDEAVDVEQPEPAATPPAPASAPKPAVAPVRAKRVTSIRGGILCSQDGVSVRYRKKCEKCGHEDPARCAAVIRTGAMRVRFYCPKCRKSRAVEMTGVG